MAERRVAEWAVYWAVWTVASKAVLTGKLGLTKAVAMVSDSVDRTVAQRVPWTATSTASQTVPLTVTWRDSCWAGTKVVLKEVKRVDWRAFCWADLRVATRGASLAEKSAGLKAVGRVDQ